MWQCNFQAEQMQHVAWAGSSMGPKGGINWLQAQPPGKPHSLSRPSLYEQKEFIDLEDFTKK